MNELRESAGAAEAVRELDDEELQRELTLAATARTAVRRERFELLLEELERRRAEGRAQAARRSSPRGR